MADGHETPPLNGATELTGEATPDRQEHANAPRRPDEYGLEGRTEQGREAVTGEDAGPDVLRSAELPGVGSGDQ